MKQLTKQMHLKLQSASTKQTVVDEIEIWDNLVKELHKFPTPDKELLPGVKWGNFGQLYTPAYWKAQYLLHDGNGHFSINYRLGDNLIQEIVGCLLGGFGLKAELGIAALRRLVERDLIKDGVSFSKIYSALLEPLIVNGKNCRYRFPMQKAKFISEFLNRNDLQSIPLFNDLTFRNWLLSVNGVGPKTASWVTRNYFQSEKVAIIDIHLFRACALMGLFNQTHRVQNDYFKLEQIFLYFCKELGVQPSKMDAVIWIQMKNFRNTSVNNKLLKQ